MTQPSTLVARRLDIAADPVALFAHVAAQPWALWFDSAAPTHSNSRWHIILYQPRQTLQLWPTYIELTDTHGQVSHYANPAWQQLCRALQQSLPACHNDTGVELPFQGGLAGAWSYDFGRQLEQLPSVASADIELPELALALYDTALLIDTKPAAGGGAQAYLLAPAEHWAATAAKWQAQLAASAPPTPAFGLQNGWQSNLTQAEYLQRFEQVQTHLRAGDAYQINLAQRFQAHYDGDSYGAYLALREVNGGPFSGYFRLPDGAILSCSPERFISCDPDGLLETKPIKGTRPRSADPAEDAAAAAALRMAAKDQAENVMIVDLLRNDFSRVCEPDSVQVPKLFAIESFPAVHHLVSTVQGKLAAPHDFLDVMAASFPGGSITGAPKISAMKIIDQLEPHRRSFYCGCLGYWSQHGQADTNIMIRTLVARQQQLYCWAGGGLVIDSDGPNEYQETLDKVQKILPVLAHD